MFSDKTESEMITRAKEVINRVDLKDVDNKFYRRRGCGRGGGSRPKGSASSEDVSYGGPRHYFAGFRAQVEPR